MNRVNHAANSHYIIIFGGDIMDIQLNEVPDFSDFRIDKDNTIYILKNKTIIDIIPYTKIKFEYGNKIYYTIDLSNISYYGTINKTDFNSYNKISKDKIESGGIIFKQIPEFPNGYFISETGIVYSTFRSKILKQEIDEDGYHRISLYKSGLSHIAIHRLVYITWKGIIPNGYVVHHQDNKKWNNTVDNIQLTTPFLNSRYAAEDGMYKRTFEWNSDIVNDVCRLMENNVSVIDIAKQYGVHPSNKKLYKNFRNQLYNFRKHQRSWIDITSKYNFNNYDGNLRPDSKYRRTDIKNMKKMYIDGKSLDEIYELYNKVPKSYLRLIINGTKSKRINVD